MTDAVNDEVRPYRSPLRAQRAAATRHAVLGAAREVFLATGYSAGTVAEIASRAGVAVDTVYASVGRKPELLRAVVESSLSGTDEAVPAEQRDYVTRIRAAATAPAKIAVYAAAVAQVQERLGPVHLALRDAGASDPHSAALWQEISDRRAANMRSFVADLRTAGGVRTDLPDDVLADVVWSTNGPEYWTLLVVGRGWSTEQFAAWLADAWCRLLLAEPAGSPVPGA